MHLEKSAGFRKHHFFFHSFYRLFSFLFICSLSTYTSQYHSSSLVLSPHAASTHAAAPQRDRRTWQYCSLFLFCFIYFFFTCDWGNAARLRGTHHFFSPGFLVCWRPTKPRFPKHSGFFPIRVHMEPSLFSLTSVVTRNLRRTWRVSMPVSR